MRTTIDLPDDLYRQLKAKAALQGRTVRETVTEYLVQGLHDSETKHRRTVQLSEPPILFPSTGKPLRSLTAAEIRALEEEDDLERFRRSSGR